MALTKVEADMVNLGADLALLHTTTVTSNVGEVQIDGHFTSAFTNYKLVGSNVHLQTDDKHLNLKFMSGGSVITGSVHRSCQLKISSNSASANGVVEAGDTEFAKACGQNIGNGTGECANFEIIIYDPLATDNFKTFSAKANNQNDGGVMILTYTEGMYNSNQAALSGIEVKPQTDAIASGVFKLYGLR